MENNAVLKRYTTLFLVTIGSFFLILAIGLTVKSSFPVLFDSIAYQIIYRLLLLYMLVIYIMLLVYLYKAAKILKTIGRINIRPSLLLIISIIATPIFFIISFIVFGLISAKTSKYLAEVCE